MCNHIHTSETQATKQVAGLDFKYISKTCSDCGATLWDSETEKSFKLWLADQAKKNRDKFTIQCVAVSDTLRSFASAFAAQFGKTESDTYQACLSYYFVYGASNPSKISIIDKIEPTAGDITKSKLRVNASVFVKIEAMAKLMDSNNSAIASWVVQRVLTAAKEHEDGISSSLQFAMAA